MTAPKLYDVKETAALVHLSVSWLYHNAGRTIPVTRPGGTRRLMWTDEQIEQIIRDGAQPAKAVKRTSQKQDRDDLTSRRTARAKATPTPGVAIPQARPERSRRYRPPGAA